MVPRQADVSFLFFFSCYLTSSFSTIVGRTVALFAKRLELLSQARYSFEPRIFAVFFFSETPFPPFSSIRSIDVFFFRLHLLLGLRVSLSRGRKLRIFSFFCAPQCDFLSPPPFTFVDRDFLMPTAVRLPGIFFGQLFFGHFPTFSCMLYGLFFPLFGDFSLHRVGRAPLFSAHRRFFFL